jgi:hypothetical protein
MPVAARANSPCSSPPRGLLVTGIDFVDEAIRRVRVKAADRGLQVEFLVRDATALGDWGERFAGASYQPPAAT